MRSRLRTKPGRIGRIHSIGLAIVLLAALPAPAQDVRVVGLFPGKALVSVDGAPPRTLSVGQETPEGIKLLAVEGQKATFEANGQRRTLGISQGFAVARTESAGNKAVITSDSRGQFWTDGMVNGRSVRFIVDTGATFVSLPAGVARSLGIDLSRARRGITSTANGIATVYAVKLDSITIGGITLHNVDASVSEGGLSVALLGMSFLSRTDMHQEGQTLTLTRRY